MLTLTFLCFDSDLLEVSLTFTGSSTTFFGVSDFTLISAGFYNDFLGIAVSFFLAYFYGLDGLGDDYFLISF